MSAQQKPALVPRALEPIEGSACPTCHREPRTLECKLVQEFLRQVGSVAKPITGSRGTTIFSESEEARGIFIVKQGTVRLIVGSGESKKLVMRICGPCSTLGLSGTVLQTKYGVTAECLTHVELLFIDALYMRRRIAESAEFGVTVAQQLSEENITTYDQVRSVFLAHCARERVAQTLLVIANISPEHTGPMPLPAGLRHEDLAEYAGISRETVTRVLADFRNRGIIENEGHRMTLVNPQELRKIISG